MIAFNRLAISVWKKKESLIFVCVQDKPIEKLFKMTSSRQGISENTPVDFGLLTNKGEERWTPWVVMPLFF